MKKTIQFIAPILLVAGSLVADPFGGKTAKADSPAVELEKPVRGNQPLVLTEPEVLEAPAYCGEAEAEKELLVEEAVAVEEEAVEFIELKKPNRANQPLVLVEPKLTAAEEVNELYAEEAVETSNCGDAEKQLHDEVEAAEVEFVELKKPNRPNQPLLRAEPKGPSFEPAL